MNNFEAFDNQVFVSTNKSSAECPRMIQESSWWVQNEGYKRIINDKNIITDYLAGTVNEGMNTEDFMFYYADIFVEGV